MSTSHGSDGHSIAIDRNGKVYSWGEGQLILLSLSLSSYLSSNVASFTFLLFFTGEHGKLGHGNNTTQKVPKLISGLNDKVIKQVSCGNRHSAAVTSDNQLYTWGEGEYGRLGKYYKCIQELMIFNGSWCIHTTSL